MNWKRVALYVALAIGATVAAGFIPGVIRGTYNASGAQPPDWTLLLQAVLVPLALLFVFVVLARVQRVRTWAHAAAVWAGSSVLSVLNLLLGLSFLEFLLGLVFSAIVAAVGVFIGLRMRPKPQIEPAAEPP